MMPMPSAWRLGPAADCSCVCAGAATCVTVQNSIATVVQVIYAKDGVSIRPTRSEAIAGRLSILRQQRMVFLAWLPYSQGCLQVLVSLECSRVTADWLASPYLKATACAC